MKDSRVDDMLTREDIELLNLEQSSHGAKRRKRRLSQAKDGALDMAIATTATNRTVAAPVVADMDGMQLDTHRRGACGYRKCFFHSRANDDEGYLIARGGYDYMARLERIWDFVRRLETKYNMRQFLLDPPKLVQLADLSTLKQLNRMARESVRTSKKSMYYGNTEEEVYEQARIDNPDAAHTVAVQRVRLAPAPNMIVRCSFFEKGREGAFRFDEQSSPKVEFAQAVTNHFVGSSSHSSRVVDERSFMEILTGEVKQLIRLLGQEPVLWYDFQFMVDYTGTIHHIDLDRIEMKGYHFPSSKGAESCLRGILKGLEKVVTGKDGST